MSAFKKNGLIFEPKMSTFSEKGVHFCAQTVSVFIEIGVCYSSKVRRKGSFCKLEYADK